MNVLEVKNLTVEFPIKKTITGKVTQKVTAVNDVSFDVKEGEIIGIVGESGCGKSSLLRALIGLNDITNGEVIWKGEHPLHKYKSHKQWLSVRRDIQMIFQDPFACLNPRMVVRNIIAEPLINFNKDLSKKEVDEKVLSIMKKVGLNESQMYRYPHEFSGGQCQRIGIARALICEPKLLVCDEPVSALDVSIQAQVVNLLKELQKDFKLTILFVAHDLSIVKHISDRLFVMYLGSLVEVSPKETIYKNPVHPYTKVLLDAIPIADPKLAKSRRFELEKAELPSPLNPPKGCAFHTRCKIATDICKKEHPSLRAIEEDVFVACHNV
jgi:oligopeptide transport system ATP-binding protein